MSTTTTTDLPQNKTMQIKQDDNNNNNNNDDDNNNNFFSRILSKENSVANPSFRVYYGGVSGSIPFTWESQPGTPKHALFSDTSLDLPLTPPPSYYKSNPKPVKKHSRSGLLHALYRKMLSLNYLKENNVVPSSSPSSLSSTSWSSSSIMYRSRRSLFSTPSSSFDSRVDDKEIAAIGSKTSTRCFIIGRGRVGKFRGCYCW